VRSGASRFARTIKTMARHGADRILVVCCTRGHFTMTAADSAALELPALRG
jgi:hypothetical protein